MKRSKDKEYCKMKPAFAVIDWDMFVLPICCYIGPDVIPKSLILKIAKECKKSRYNDVLTSEFVRDTVKSMACDDEYVRARTRSDDSVSFIRIWAYSDDVLAHEILHVIENVCRDHNICDDEFKCYALQWLLCDFRYKLTGVFAKPFHFRVRD